MRSPGDGAAGRGRATGVRLGLELGDLGVAERERGIVLVEREGVVALVAGGAAGAAGSAQLVAEELEAVVGRRARDRGHRRRRARSRRRCGRASRRGPAERRGRARRSGCAAASLCASSRFTCSTSSCDSNGFAM